MSNPALRILSLSESVVVFLIEGRTPEIKLDRRIWSVAGSMALKKQISLRRA